MSERERHRAKHRALHQDDPGDATQEMRRPAEIVEFLAVETQKRGWNHRALARGMKVSIDTIRAWFNGRRQPGIDKVEKLFELTGITFADYVDKHRRPTTQEETTQQ
ncbi:helix-turn-helix domain-containing protein [Dactylosporangium sp. CS-033363]|uniref:helix-turn-helix domain-containing protein n=1 Tax=Dactylosporangium sp. CS-033363 TaxID=3239935 RepID=UPI003D916B96